jgi:hypothetical protein
VKEVRGETGKRMEWTGEGKEGTPCFIAVGGRTCVDSGSEYVELDKVNQNIQQMILARKSKAPLRVSLIL